MHIYSEGCGAVWLELLALNIRNLPGLTTLILNCWDDGKICCPDDIDDVLPDITERAERLKLLTLGPGVQPSINGLRLILNRSTVRVVNSYLCRTLHHPTVARELIELIRNSSVEILRTKVAQTTTQLIAAIEEILAKNHSKPNTTYILRESVNVLSVKSTVLANLTLFRLRKVNLVEPINRLRELRPIIPKGMGTEKALCGISSLCGPNSSSLTYEDCVHHSKGLESQPANSSSNRASVLQDRIQLRVANSMNGVENIKFTEVHNVTWVHWDDTDLAQHFQSLDEALQNDLKRTRTHWIQFLCIDENDIRH